ncbi:hypothetical protein SAMN04515671_1236 [Nakamurella panacisegetis]|uniref:CopC domain-containing protein n=1 Tax=Nakamurella panacisegetis TaxID=1090615 RepID=A0A1H0KB93_9ACTN|nr:copper resistance CopC family protein [Nakamurella panacisegetis]SDO53031.1 hypothetical protein SAMN04515671_1236 [Nakamurella panacisegetis]
MTIARRALIRLLAGLVLAVGLSVAVAGSASAHDVLISSTPADGSTLKAAPSTVTFVFDQPVQNFDPVIALIGPDGKHYESGTARVDGSTVSGSVTSGPAGAYIASYRIVSADGHPVTGEVHFTLAAGATPVTGSGATSGSATSGSAASGSAAASRATAAVTSGAPTSSAVVTPETTKSRLSAWVWIGLIVAAVVIAIAAVIILRRPPGKNAPDRVKSADRDY